jgi:hypothetical protein
VEIFTLHRVTARFDSIVFGIVVGIAAAIAVGAVEEPVKIVVDPIVQARTRTHPALRCRNRSCTPTSSRWFKRAPLTSVPQVNAHHVHSDRVHVIGAGIHRDAPEAPDARVLRKAKRESRPLRVSANFDRPFGDSAAGASGWPRRKRRRKTASS